MKRFEYKLKQYANNTTDTNMVHELNTMGHNGWELVHLKESNGMCVFKRELNQE